ncbi:MAG: LAGLIDADG family homing endonuclease [Candidatus Diapherotrites archaeon]
MIKIKRLRVKNFKSFRKANIPLSDGFTVIAGSNASGKCVLGDTLIQLSDGGWARADAIVENAIACSRFIRKMDDGFYTVENPHNISVSSLNPETMKIEKRKVDAFIKREAPSKIIKIKTRSGREISTTPYHPLFVLTGGVLEASKAENLTAGVKIAVPRKLVKEKNSNFFHELLGEIRVSDSLYAPINQDYASRIKKFKERKKLKMGELAVTLGIPRAAIKSLFEGQAINLAYLIKALGMIGFSKEEIIAAAPYAKGKTSAKKIRIPWKNSPEFSRFLGYLIAEGSNSKNQVRFVNGCKEMVQDFESLAEKLFSTKAKSMNYKNGSVDSIIYSEPLGKILSKFGFKKGGKARDKFIADWFAKHSGERELSEFINGLYSGDGYVASNTLNIVSASERLAKGIFTILLQLGLIPTLSKRRKAIKSTGFSGEYWHVDLYGSENLKRFNKLISLSNPEKRERLSAFAARNFRKHSNVDLIPNLNESIYTACKELCIKPMRKKGRNSRLQAYCRNMCEVSRNGLNELIKGEFSGKGKSEALENLKMLANSDIFWDEIISIKEEKSPEKYVYDLAISGHHNFVANNIFVHNSNILDALLFVLGATSLKMLRASRMIELVNHDSEDGYAKVEVELAQAGKTYLISRAIDKQGKGIVRLDGKRVGLNEVQALLQELGIRVDGHNIVVQGDITRVIEMNARERREIIDDAAGLSEFEEKKKEALEKLDKVDRRIKDTFLVLNEREKRLQELEKEKESAQRHTELSEKLRQSKATILSEEMRKIRVEMDGFEKKKEEIAKEIARKEEEKKQLREQEQQLEEKLDATTKKMLEASEKTYSTVGRQVEEKRAEKKFLEEKLRERQLEAQKTLMRIENLKQKEAGLKLELREKEAELNAKETELHELAQMIAPIEEKAGRKSAVLKKKNLELGELEKQLNEIREKLHQKQKSLHEKEIRLAEAGKEKKMLHQFTERKEKEAEELGLHEKLLEVRKLKEKMRQLEKELNSANAELNEWKNKAKGIRSEIEKVQAKVEKIMQVHGLVLKEIEGIEEFISGFLKGKAEHEKEGEEKAIGARISELEKEKSGIAEELAEFEKGAAKTGAAIAAIMQELRGEGAELIERLESLNAKKNLLLQETASLKAELKEAGKRVKEFESGKNEAEKQLEHGSNELKELEGKEKTLNRELEEKEAELDKATKANKVLEEEKSRLTEKMKALDEKIGSIDGKISKIERETNEINIEASKNEVRIADMESEFQQFTEVKLLKEFNLSELKKALPSIEKEINSLGAINMKALQDFDGFKAEVDDVRGKAQKLEEERLAVLNLIDKIEVKKISVFMDCFSTINKKFNELYFNFFGGEGRLGLTVPEKPLEGGLSIEAKYSEEKLKSIDAMSGGEKSLTALAFLFAIQSFTPAPFYIFDEVDAALDKENSLKLVRLVKEISRQSQFLAITHNDSVIKQSDQIIGVALNKQKSSVIGLKLKDRIADFAEKENNFSEEESDEGDFASEKANSEEMNEEQFS